MPYFLRHYAPWVDRLTFFDDHSTDGTRELITACPKAILRDWPGSKGVVDDEFMDFANEQWKEARGHAEWVIFVDGDEFLYHENMLTLLDWYLHDGVTAPRIQGYTMVHPTFPTTDGQIYDEVKTGFRDDAWSKHAIFREDIHFTVGRHSLDLNKCKPVFSANAEIKLLHYRALGLKYLTDRHTRNWARVPDRCRRLSYGVNTNPEHDGHHGIAWFAEILKKEHPCVI